jgi:hypothetical protein
MIIQRTKFFLLVFLLILVVDFTPKIAWLSHTQRTKGVIEIVGKGEAGDQVPLSYTIISFHVGKDSISFNGLGNLRMHPGDSIPVRYRTDDIRDVKVDVFAGIWGDTLIYGGIPTLMLLVMFLHPNLVPRRSKIRLTTRKPFIRIN